MHRPQGTRARVEGAPPGERQSHVSHGSNKKIVFELSTIASGPYTSFTHRTNSKNSITGVQLLPLRIRFLPALPRPPGTETKEKGLHIPCQFMMLNFFSLQHSTQCGHRQRRNNKPQAGAVTCGAVTLPPLELPGHREATEEALRQFRKRQVCESILQGQK